MSFSLRGAILVLTVIVPFMEYVSAENPEQQENIWYESIAVHGFVSAAYSYNFNQPDSGLNQLRTFDFDDNSLKVDVAEIVFQRSADESGQTGFRIDLTAGSSIPKIAAASGLFRDFETGKAEDFDLQQAYVVYNFRGLQLDFGKHTTHTGFELIEGYDGFNNHYSHSYLFGFAVPFTHTGLRASYSFNKKISAVFLLANGWDSVKDNNDGKTIGFQIGVTPHSRLSAYLNYLGGPEQANNDDNMRHLVDIVLNFSPSDRVLFSINYDFGTEENVQPGKDADWAGIAGYVRFMITDDFGVNLRGEFFDDEQGFRTGTPQELMEFTVTPEFRLQSNVFIRADLRFDQSSEEVFEEEGSPSDRQTTFAVNAIYRF